MPKKEPEDVKQGTIITKEGELVPLAGGATMTVAQFEDWLRNAKNEQDDDAGEDPYMRILRQTLNAKTPDDVLTPIEALKARDLVGHALIAEGFEFNESEYDVGSPMYASIRCVYVSLLPPQELEILKIDRPSPPIVTPTGKPALFTGDSIVVNCGHKKVITQLVVLRQMNAFPRKVVFAERGKSKVSGSPMLTLLKWGKDDDIEADAGKMSESSG